MPRLGRLQRLALAAGVAAHLALPGEAAAADPAFSLRGALSAGLDSNARRHFGRGEADLMASGLLAAVGKLGVGPLELGGSYEAAARKFILYPSQDTLGQEANAEIAARPLRTVLLALGGRAKDRRGGPRVYTDLQGSLALRWRAVPELEVELRGGARRFIDWALFEYSFSSPEAGATVRYRFNRQHALSLTGDLGQRRYNALAVPRPGSPDPLLRRTDGVLSAGGAYSFRSGFQLSAGYRYLEEDSNSYGHTARLHRLEIAGGVPLPWEWLLFGQLTVQLADYPDGLFLSGSSILQEDEERHNALSLKLVRPLGEWLDLELRYGLYLNAFQVQSQFRYQRQVASVGLAARM